MLHACTIYIRHLASVIHSHAILIVTAIQVTASTILANLAIIMNKVSSVMAKFANKTRIALLNNAMTIYVLSAVTKCQVFTV